MERSISLIKVAKASLISALSGRLNNKILYNKDIEEIS